jgi:hypothetical protein
LPLRRGLSEEARGAGEQRHRLLEIIAVGLLLFNMSLSAIAQLAEAPSTLGLLGALITDPLILVVVLGAATLWKGPLARRTRAKIAIVTLIVLLLGLLGQIGKGQADHNKDDTRPSAAEVRG